jgi:nicotinate (nicotinamide) nucleotide adenylyltransferase
MTFTQNIANLQALNFMRNSNLRIGVLGGTFNPAHPGHLSISVEALNFYKFDYVIWLVANQNPLKDTCENNIFTRAKQSLEIAKHPRIIVSTAEHDLKSYYIYDSLKSLITRFPNVQFSWLMGIDNAANFKQWHKYTEIPKLCNIIIFDRPVKTRLINSSAFALKPNGVLAKNQRNHIIIHRENLCNISSTEIRENE